MDVIDRLQVKYQPPVQAAGMAYAFLAFCKRNKVHPGTVLQVAQRLQDDTPNHTTEMRAVRRYMDEEVSDR